MLDVLTVFTADGCPHCDRLVADLRQRGVRFEEVNLSREPEAMDRLAAICWEHRLPIVLDHEKVSVGHDGRSSSFEELGLRRV